MLSNELGISNRVRQAKTNIFFIGEAVRGAGADAVDSSFPEQIIPNVLSSV